MDIIDNVLMVLKDVRYLTLFIFLTGFTMYIFGLFMQVIFVSPNFVINLSGFFSGVDILFFFIVPILSSLTITMVFYRLTKLKVNLQKENKGGFVTSIFSLFISACTCSGILPLLTIFGSAGIVWISRYLNELRILAMMLVFISLYFTAKNLLVGCKIKVK